MNKSEWMQWVKAFVLAILIAVFVKHFLFTSYVVEGKSMLPSLQGGNRLIVNKADYHITPPHRFEVIIFHANEKEDYVKRVIGLPGDAIVYENDVLYVNGKAVKEPYLDPFKKQLVSGKLTQDFTLKEETGRETVPEGKLWVMGDNRQISADSREFGFVDMSQVVGKVDVRVWPFNEIKLMP